MQAGESGSFSQNGRRTHALAHGVNFKLEQLVVRGFDTPGWHGYSVYIVTFASFY